MKAEVSRIERDAEKTMDRLINAESDSAIRAYEKRLGDLDTKKHLLKEKISNCGKPLHTYEETFKHSMNFLSNPWKIWENGSIEYRQTVLKLAFADQLAYDRDNGFRTPKVSLPFKVLEDICSGNEEMAHRGRFELPTPRFVV